MFNLFARKSNANKHQAGVCPNCAAAVRADANFCPRCGTALADVKLPGVSVRVVESQRSMSIQFADLARKVYRKPFVVVEEPREADRLGFPDECPGMFGTLSTLCLALDGQAALCIVSSDRTDPWDHRKAPFRDGRPEPIRLRVLMPSLFDGAVELAATYQAKAQVSAEVVKEF